VDIFLRELEKLIGPDWFHFVEIWYDSVSSRFQVTGYNKKLHRTFELSYDYGVPHNFSQVYCASGITAYLKEKGLSDPNISWN